MPQFPIRIDKSTIPALVVGAALLIASIALMLTQWRAYQRLSEKINEAGYHIAERQIRHRFAVGVMLFLLGVMIPLGDQLDFIFRRHPGLFFFYWMGVLLLVFAMVIFVLGDVLSTLAYARVSQVELRQERHELEEKIRRYRATQAQTAANGKPGEE